MSDPLVRLALGCRFWKTAAASEVQTDTVQPGRPPPHTVRRTCRAGRYFSCHDSPRVPHLEGGGCLWKSRRPRVPAAAEP